MNGIKKALTFLYRHSSLPFLIIGVLCIVLNNVIYSIFPYIFSGLMIAVGILGLSLDLIHMVKRRFVSLVFSYSLVIIVLGIIYLIQPENMRLSTMGITWGLVGIIKGGAELSVSIEHIMKKSKWWIASMIQAVVTIAISLLLIINPVESIHHHIIIFGVELIVVSLASIGGIKEEVSLWYLLKVEPKKQCTCEKQSEEHEKSVA